MAETAAEHRRGIRIGIDTGGTFTDVVAVESATGRIVTTKTPSTPADPSVGFLDGVRKVLGLLEAGGEDVTGVSHGTTVATNALLEDAVETVGLITTEGYRHILEIARQSVPDGYGNSYFWVKPDRIVPVDLVREVGGRLDHTGREVRPFDEDGARTVARWFRKRGIDTIGVCLLHAYANDVHERRLLEILVEEHPDAVVSLSSEVLREYREYERTVTTLVDASVKPKVTRYVRNIAARLDEATGDGRDVPFYVMKSNGGVISADEVVHQPITTVLSGPAAGALGAALVASEAGYDRLLTCDGGGTSTDVSVVLGGEPTLTTEGSVGRFPSKIPMIDIVTVGAGGGSIAWIGPEGTLKVGPRSAGADPGPLCYGRGGTEPTVTDAHVYLGRIPPHLLGGEIALDRDAAQAGIEALAGKLGLSPQDAARGILEISAWNQANAIRQVTVKRGLDVRDFPMAAFGGSGPLLVCRLIDILGLPAVLVPRDPGNLSAFGLLTVDVKNDYVQTHVVRDDALDRDELSAVYGALQARAADALDREGFPTDAHRFQRTADLRYDGQAFEVRVPAPDGPVDAAFQRAVVDAFHDEHERLYGYAYRPTPGDEGSAHRHRHAVEWVNLRVTGIGPIERPVLPRLEAGDGDPGRARTGERPVVFGGDAVDTPVYAREHLLAGDVVVGPAIVEEFGSTVPVHPGFTARVDELANLVLEAEGTDR
ncbi:hydantoinase/oxoprolinase family protein [Egicoccus halophilus]|uniref:5-oxoprolinase n=1 Tax=Egicoccus halophilus TaxID=1670830 RepID=A0A8J3EW89_9ACTN|nr:hydantoinase/oxoprolinase family protein [Egicoccus halophilus]GGI09820.1 5-oxoprolinase [Egicoccus halophilus]